MYKEWTIFLEEANQAANYPKSSLTGVYFGPEMEDSHAEIICLILQAQNPKVRFYKGTRSPVSYKVFFSEVTYTSEILKSQNSK